MNVSLADTSTRGMTKKEANRMEVWREISTAWRMITRGAEKNLSPLGICTTEFKILRILEEDGPTPMARLSDAIALTQPAITSFVDKLELQGMVKRERNQDDRRVIRIAMTKKGQALLGQGMRLHSKFIDGLLSEISDSELSKLSTIMKKISIAKITIQNPTAS